MTVQEVGEAYKNMKQGRTGEPSEVCTEILREIKYLNVVWKVVNELLA